MKHKSSYLLGREPPAQFMPAGFGLVETVVGAAILSVVLFSLVQVGQFTFRLVDESNLKLRAAFLAEEGLEAVRIIRDTSWSNLIASSALDTDYFIEFTGQTFALQLNPVPPSDGIYERRIRFSSVYRDANDDITTTGGALDPNTRRVSVTVSWANRGRLATTTISTYLSNLFNN
ncbi:MAG: hypothetical protein AAB650_02840 [Patescibacteria group bacterium]